MTAALEGGEWSAALPGRTLLPIKTRYPFYRKLGGPQGRSERAENLVATSIRSRTVLHVVSRYTDWATGPTLIAFTWGKIAKRPRLNVTWYVHCLWCSSLGSKFGYKDDIFCVVMHFYHLKAFGLDRHQWEPKQKLSQLWENGDHNDFQIPQQTSVSTNFGNIKGNNV